MRLWCRPPTSRKPQPMPETERAQHQLRQQQAFLGVSGRGGHSGAKSSQTHRDLSDSCSHSLQACLGSAAGQMNFVSIQEAHKISSPLPPKLSNGSRSRQPSSTPATTTKSKSALGSRSQHAGSARMRGHAERAARSSRHHPARGRSLEKGEALSSAWADAVESVFDAIMAVRQRSADRRCFPTSAAHRRVRRSRQAPAGVRTPLRVGVRSATVPLVIRRTVLAAIAGSRQGRAPAAAENNVHQAVAGSQSGKAARAVNADAFPGIAEGSRSDRRDH